MNLTDADKVWFEQQKQAVKENEHARVVALNNDRDHCQVALEKIAEDAITERHESNGQLFNAFVDKPGFREKLLEYLAGSYDEIRKRGRGVVVPGRIDGIDPPLRAPRKGAVNPEDRDEGIRAVARQLASLLLDGPRRGSGFRSSQEALLALAVDAAMWRAEREGILMPSRIEVLLSDSPALPEDAHPL